MTATSGDRRPALSPITMRRIAIVMAGVAATLGVLSALHLSGGIHGRSAAFNAADAGVAEAAIGAILAGGALAVARFGEHARSVALAAIGFAAVGFVVGLTFTAGGGDLLDIIYHVAVLPLLFGAAVVLIRRRNSTAT
ncbi:MAG: hypothetical protein JO337_13010 [Acidimicrobiales bacterium]|nr:hypothetical protein [Acidimicrobiales bacterium]